MIAQNDVARSTVVCDRISLVINRDNIKPDMKLDLNLGANWGVYAVREDKRSVKSRVKYVVKSAVIEGEIEATVVTDFNREVIQEELSSKDFQKELALSSVSYAVQWIADVSSKMGISQIGRAHV